MILVSHADGLKQEAETLGAPFSIILAEDEWAKGEVKVRAKYSLVNISSH